MWCKCCVLCNHNRLQIPVIDRLASLNLENLTFFTADDDLIFYFFFSCIDTSVMSTWIMPMIYAITASLGFNSFLTHFLIQCAVQQQNIFFTYMDTYLYKIGHHCHLWLSRLPMFSASSVIFVSFYFLMKKRLLTCSSMKISEFLDLK